VILILSLVLQLLVDHAQLGWLEWPIRIAAPAAALLVSGGYFGAAHLPGLRWLLYSGAVVLAATTLVVGVGLLKARQP